MYHIICITSTSKQRYYRLIGDDQLDEISDCPDIYIVYSHEYLHMCRDYLGQQENLP